MAEKFSNSVKTDASTAAEVINNNCTELQKAELKTVRDEANEAKGCVKELIALWELTKLVNEGALAKTSESFAQ